MFGYFNVRLFYLKKILLACSTVGFIHAAVLTDDASSIDAVLGQSITRALINEVKTNFRKLSITAETKQAHHLYRLLGALLMTGNQQAVDLHDAILASGYRRDSDFLRATCGLTWGSAHLSGADEHIISARFKAAQLPVFRNNMPEFSSDLQVWKLHQASLMLSLTSQERQNLTHAKVMSDIITSVLMPDTLLMGMHPFQRSVFQDRQTILFNPRVTYVDWEAWESLDPPTNVAPAIFRDLERRTFAADFSEDKSGHSEFTHMNKHKDQISAWDFVVNHVNQYRRMIFDSCCRVTPGTLFWQNVLFPRNGSECSAAYEEHSDALPLDGKPDEQARIPGGMPLAAVPIHALPEGDRFFVGNVFYNLGKESLVNQYLRIDDPYEYQGRELTEAEITFCKQRAKEQWIEQFRNKENGKEELIRYLSTSAHRPHRIRPIVEAVLAELANEAAGSSPVAR